MLNNCCYNVHRLDRPSRGGGIAILLKNNYQHVRLPLADKYTNLEVIAIDLYTPIKLRLICCYCAPDADITHINLLCELLSELSDICFPVTIVGDFNMPNINWIDPVISGPAKESLFLNCLLQNSLSQLVLEPTRGHNILDLILTNCNGVVNDVNISEPFSTSDHSILNFNIVCPSHTNKGYEIFDFKNADYNAISLFLVDYDWSLIFLSCSDVNQMWQLFTDVLRTAVNLYVPKIWVGGKKGISYPTYIQDMLKRKRVLWRKFKREKTPMSKQAYRTFSSKCNNAINKFSHGRESKILNSGNKNSIYKWANSKLRSHTGIAPLKNPQGDIVTSDSEKCSVLNNCFSNVFTKDNSILPNIPNFNIGDTCDFIIFHPATVFEKLGNLPLKTSLGPDGFPPILFNKLKAVLCVPLALIFERSFITNTLPEDWLVADIIPIFKKGDVRDPSNYRPISLTCVACKVMESIINDNIMSFLLSKSLISPNQFGFMKRRSTVTQILKTI